ncbi:MAG: hypothetical protein IH944_05865 [Armatimonadetes bacterium]|nr:hypothetical protein [Armatimonadota bacterium]
MSRVISDGSEATSFIDALGPADELAERALHSKPKVLRGRDAAREKGREQGYRIGFFEGVEKGKIEGDLVARRHGKADFDKANAEHSAKFAASVEQAMAQFEQQRAEWFEHAEQTLADLAIEIARRAIGRELETTREGVVDLVKQVLEEVTDGTRVRLRVNPMDASALEAQLTEIKAAFSHLRNVEVVSDRSVGFGCRIESDAGMIDARVESYLGRIASEAQEGR